MGNKSDSTISRREFVRHAAFVSAAASLVPSNLLNTDSLITPPPAQQPSNAPKLSPESQAEVEARIQSVFALYGSRLSDPQKPVIHPLPTKPHRTPNPLRP